MADDIHSEALASHRPLDFGRVATRAWISLKSHLGWIAALGLLIILIPIVLAFQTESPATGFAFFALADAGLRVGLVAFLSLLFQAILIRRFVPLFWNEPTDMKTVVQSVLKYIWPLLGLFLIVSMAISVGLNFLILPGLVLAAGWFVVIPVLIGEGLGPIGALKRSWTLTTGYKWQTVGILLIWLVGGWVCGYAFDALLLMLLMPSVAVLPWPVLGFALGWILSSSVLAAIVSATYFELRYARGEFDLLR